MYVEQIWGLKPALPLSSSVILVSLIFKMQRILLLTFIRLLQELNEIINA